MRNKILTVAIITGILLVSGMTSVMAGNISDGNTGDMQNHKCSSEMMTNMEADYPKDIMSGYSNTMMGGRMMGDIDRNFIEQMIPHHKMAITEADIALQKAEHEEIKKLATDIKTAQAKEIDDMRSWYKEWYGTEVPEYPTGMGMMSGDTSIERLNNTDNFDKEFIEQMIHHHQMAIMMADIALQKAEREEIKKIAADIKTAQAKEIDDMRSWYKEWYGTEVPENPTGMGDMMSDGMMDGGMMGDGMMSDELWR
ncbi:MAG: DUF305 domain-containing protein [Candidatus Methanoperedens sp.]|nr:DUF305 domain-containing protein [Candidatus Methanoperedens sp.]